MIYTLIQHSVAEQGPSAPPDSSGASPQPQPQPQQQRVSIHKPFTQSRVPSDLPMHPAPRHITEEELHVLEGCLHRWRSEVENDTRGAAITSSTHTDTYTYTCHVRFLTLAMYLSCQICKGVYQESTEPSSSCTQTRR